MPTGVVVAAAGRGERLGSGPAKALRLLAGEPLIVHAVRSLAAADSVGVIVVAAPPADVDAVRALLSALVPASVDVVVVPGGNTRQESVRRALAVLPASVEVVLVHDVARPLVPASLVESVIDAVRAGADAVVPALEVSDTVKAVQAGSVAGTVDRANLRTVQTPQGFRRALLVAAYDQADPDQPDADDAALVEATGVAVAVVAGAVEAFKVTGPMDLTMAEATLLLRAEQR